MLTACAEGESTIYKVDVLKDGTFGGALPRMATITKGEQSQSEFWNLIHRPVSPLPYISIDRKVTFAEG